MAVHLKHHALALAIALIGLASTAQAQTTQEEVRNGRFTTTTTITDPLRLWNDTNVLVADRNTNAAANQFGAKFDYGVGNLAAAPSFLSQSLGTFASGTSFTLTFDFISVFKVAGNIVDNVGTKATAFERNLATAPLLQYGFQVLSGGNWNWIGGAASSWDPDVSFAELIASEAGTNVSKTFDLTSTRNRQVRVAFEGLGGIEKYGYYPTIDNVSVMSVTAAVPEPETYAMLLAGLGAIGFMSRRRQARTA